jgi:DDE superfamily endonuclease
VHFVDFLCYVDAQISAEKERIYAIMDNLEMHHCRDLLLFMIHHPRWEFVYQPTYAAYLNLIEPWWKVLLALVGAQGQTRGSTGSRSRKRSRKPPPTGMPISIPLSGVADAAISLLVVLRSSPSRSKLCAFSECTTK